MLLSIKNCERCGGEHKRLFFRPLASSSHGWSHWALCPVAFNREKAAEAAAEFAVDACKVQNTDDVIRRKADDLLSFLGEPIFIRVGGGVQAPPRDVVISEPQDEDTNDPAPTATLPPAQRRNIPPIGALHLPRQAPADVETPGGQTGSIRHASESEN